ncbi:Carbohydrate binding module (family 6) [Planctomycetes bacterium CA13]|uniref:Carbohydrate binding module (Family 6) n=1 Tax=Novipirellula herctigrandis TaxID=2527986 RepID=A0A5C5ZB12_9BACT|nr:Carbohydrate binding module (family 6) [Planctomycetes bacterium CA13]
MNRTDKMAGTFTLLYMCVLMSLASVVQAALPSVHSDSFRYKNKTYSYRVELFDVRGPDYQVQLQTEADRFEAYDPGPVRTYVGTVQEDPKAMVVGYLRKDGSFRGAMYWDRYSKRMSFDRGQMVSESNIDYPQTFDEPRRQFLQGGRMTDGVYQFMLGIDIPSSVYHKRLKRDPELALEVIEFSAAQVAAIYLRDAKLKQAVNHVVIRDNRAVDPYQIGPDALSRATMSAQWKDAGSHLSSVDYDKLLLFHGSSAGLGGLTAGTGVSGKPPRADLVWRHELLHTFNPRNDEGGYPEGATIMVRYSRFNRISSTELEAVVNYRDTKQAKTDMFDVLGDYAVPLPPYGNYDFARVTHGSAKSLKMDVLANDHDVNGDALMLVDVEPKSRLGAQVALSKGTGPQGRDEVVYHAPNRIGMDAFKYTISDGLYQFNAVVVVDVQPDHRIFEAEEAKSSGRKLRLGSGNTGTGSVRLSAAGQMIDWTVQANQGSHGLKIRFGQTDELRRMDLYVNGQLIQGDVAFPPTGKRAEWRYVGFPRVPLNRGKNTIRLKATDNAVTLIDHLMVHSETDIRINFSSRLTPDNYDTAWKGIYCHDEGLAFGQREYGDLEYGWTRNVNDSIVRGINQVAANDLGSCIRMQSMETSKWEIALPNGDYHITIACGDADPNASDHINDLLVEGRRFEDPDGKDPDGKDPDGKDPDGKDPDGKDPDGKDPDGKDQFDFYDGVVTVTDGRLTITPAPSAINTKLCYVCICDRHKN